MELYVVVVYAQDDISHAVGPVNLQGAEAFIQDEYPNADKHGSSYLREGILVCRIVRLQSNA